MADQAHDAYGKAVLRAAAGSALADSGLVVELDYGTKSRCRIDGAVGDIATELESRTSTQVPALVDLGFRTAV